MIPRTIIIEWRKNAPWPANEQIEHDLVLSRAICELYQNPLIQKQLAFRGGTALHKLFITPAGRFSEDLDFVQIKAGPIGDLVQAIRSCLDHWLGEPTWKQNQGRFTLNYAFKTEFEPVVKRKVKVEINTREHFNTQPYIHKSIQVDSSWYYGEAQVLTYGLEELMGTKLRALYQRKKGRDLYDFWCVLSQYPDLNIKELLHAYQTYIEFVGSTVSRAEFEKNLNQKQKDRTFNEDVRVLLPSSWDSQYDVHQAFELLYTKIVTQLPGEPLKYTSGLKN